MQKAVGQGRRVTGGTTHAARPAWPSAGPLAARPTPMPPHLPPASPPAPVVVPVAPVPVAPAPVPAGAVTSPVEAPAVAPPVTPAATPTAGAYTAAVAARFPDPPVVYRTPAFLSGRTDFTSNAEIAALLRGLVRDGRAHPSGTSIRLLPLGSS